MLDIRQEAWNQLAEINNSRLTLAMRTIVSVLSEKIKKDKNYFFECVPSEKRRNQLLRNILERRVIIERLNMLKRRDSKVQKMFFFKKMRKLNDDHEFQEIKKYVFFKLITKTIHLQMRRLFVIKNSKSIFKLIYYILLFIRKSI